MLGLALAAPCGDLASLELQAARAPLAAPVEQCLEASLTTSDSAQRASASFVLILSAYSGGDEVQFLNRMRRHMESFHSTDPEVAYLLARHLWSLSDERAEPPYADEILRWSRTAMNGRSRWLHNRRNYDEMVRNLHDMLVQSSLQVARTDRAEARSNPSEQATRKADESQRRARHYLIVAAPCLHRGECGPTLEVYVEGMAECDALGPLENYASAGRLDDGHRACLRARFRGKTAPRRRILEILISDAEQQSTATPFEMLLAWHWNVTDSDDPEVAYRFARWLKTHSGDPALLAQWADVALTDADDARRGELLVWRSEAWGRVAAAAQAAHAEAPTERTRREADVAAERVEAARASAAAWCAERECP